MMMDEMMRQMMGGFGPLAVLLNVLITLGLLALVVWALTRIFSHHRGEDGSPNERTDRAEEILRERFARGELDAEEYRRSLAVLRGGPEHGDRQDSHPGPEER